MHPTEPLSPALVHMSDGTFSHVLSLIIECMKLRTCYHFVDVTKPLMGALQEKQGVIPLPASCPSQSIVDVSENMRAKIYSIFCKIGE